MPATEPEGKNFEVEMALLEAEDMLVAYSEAGMGALDNAQLVDWRPILRSELLRRLTYIEKKKKEVNATYATLRPYEKRRVYFEAKMPVLVEKEHAYKTFLRRHPIFPATLAMAHHYATLGAEKFASVYVEAFYKPLT